MQMHIMEFSM